MSDSCISDIPMPLDACHGAVYVSSMHRPHRIVLLAAVAAILLTSCDQSSVAWGPVDSSYGGITRVRASGTWVNESSRSAVNRITYRDTAPNDGNTVYVHTLVRWWKYNRSADRVDWVNGSSKSTPETSSSTYIDRSVSWSLDSQASRARAVPNVCAQMGFPIPDSCTGGGVPTFDY